MICIEGGIKEVSLLDTIEMCEFDRLSIFSDILWKN